MSSAHEAMVRGTGATHGHDLILRCPHCGSLAGETARRQMAEQALLACSSCYTQLRCRDGIWNALAPAREAHYAGFIANYEKIREAEGRGSRNAEFYLALPYEDITGRNQAQWAIRARSFECLEKQVMPLLEATHGRKLDVLDLGAGNGWLSYRLCLRGHQAVAVDLLDNGFDGLGAARHYRARIPNLFPLFRADLQNLPFADQQFDVAIFNASFHYSEDYTRTLAETLRCLRRPGYVVICDTPWYRRPESGHAMLRERRAFFETKYGSASEDLRSLEFLTDERLRRLEGEFNLRWTHFHPRYGWRWRLRPWIARLRRRREPSTFRIYLAEVLS